MEKFVKIAVIWTCCFLFSACDRNAPEGRAAVLIQMPSASEIQKMSKNVSGFSVLDPRTVCFAVNIKGPGIPSLAETKSCNIRRGIFSDSVGVGSELAIENVEVGDDRIFELYAFIKTDANITCPTNFDGEWKWPLENVYFLGKVEGIKVHSGMAPVEIPYSLPDSNSHIVAQNSWPTSCLTGSKSAGAPVGRVVTSGSTLISPLGYKVYSKISPLSDQKTLGTTYKIHNWKVGQ